VSTVSPSEGCVGNKVSITAYVAQCQVEQEQKASRRGFADENTTEEAAKPRAG
jgi:hypothetical protein